MISISTLTSKVGVIGIKSQNPKWTNCNYQIPRKMCLETIKVPYNKSVVSTKTTHNSNIWGKNQSMNLNKSYNQESFDMHHERSCSHKTLRILLLHVIQALTTIHILVMLRCLSGWIWLRILRILILINKLKLQLWGNMKIYRIISRIIC